MTQAISLCMITKNEENNIERCLNSVKGIADEIIIVDTGSTDRTKDIANDVCKKFATEGNFFDFKIFDFKWNDDFSAARNESIKHAAKDWILVLDADEILDEEGARKIGEIVKKEKADGFLFPQKNYTNESNVAGYLPCAEDEFSKGYSGFYISIICRLFRNRKGYNFSGLVHELVEPSIQEKKGEIAIEGVLIHHYGNSNPEISNRKKRYYLMLSEKKAEKNPTAENYCELGILYKENSRVEEAEKSFLKAVSLNDKNAAALYELGIINEAKNNFDKAIEYYKKCVQIKNDGEAFFGLGTCYLKKNMLKESFEYFTKSLIINPNKYSIYNNLGAIHERNGNFKEAVEMLEIGIRLNPMNVIGFYNLGVVYDKIREKEKALACFERALALGHKNKEILEKKIKELKLSVENSVKYRYSFNAGNDK